MFCRNCGTKLDDGTVFCPNCGTKTEDGNVATAQSGYTNAVANAPINEAPSFANANVQPNANAGASAATGAAVTEEEQLENAFITGNSSGNAGIGNSFLHYKKSFAAFRAGKSVQWNWAAAFLNIYNFAYRKQYLLAAVFVCLGGIETLLSSAATHVINGVINNDVLPDFMKFRILLHTAIPHIIVIGIGMFIIAGCIGDKSLYKKFVTQKNIAIASFPNDIEKQKTHTAQNGGTKKSAIWVFIGIYVVLSAIINATYNAMIQY